MEKKEYTNNDEKGESTITDMTNEAIKEVFEKIKGTSILTSYSTYGLILESFEEKEYRDGRGEVKYDHERLTLKSRGNETKIEKIFENGIIRIEGLDFDIPIKEGIRLLNFKNRIKYMKKTKREKGNPNIIFLGTDETKKRRMTSNTFYNYDIIHTKLVKTYTVEKYCPTISQDETAMKKIAKRLNE